MDIHRCRFVPFPASPINALAFSHPLLPSKRQARLAIGRANGNIEIWNPLNGTWFHETTIHGGRDRSVDTLVWVTGEDETLQDGNVIAGRSRLFSSGYTSAITEWDLEKGRARKHASGQHGDIWCLAAQPASQKETPNGIASPSQPQRLVAGTIDGSIVLYSIDDDDLQFQRTLVKTPKKNVKMVSIAFQDRQTVVVGCSDSTIRVYDMRNGHLQKEMTVGKDKTGGSKNIIIWSVKCLKNGDIVSGDSTGQICIWDGKTLSQAQRIQGHDSDVLSLAVSADGQRIVSGGLDRRTALYRPVNDGVTMRWQRVDHRRYHKHDVKAMATFEGLGMSVVVTAGTDAAPVVIPLRQAGKENHRKLSHMPQSVPLQSAPQARVMVSWWGREVHLWKFREWTSENSQQAEKKDRPRIGQILIKGESNITSCSISRDGSILIVSTATAIKAFHLTIPNLDPKEELKVRRVEVPSTIESAGATIVQISPDSRWLGWIQEGSEVRVAEITREDHGFSIRPRPSKLARLRRDIPKHVQLGGLANYERRVTHITFSPDSSLLATADLAGYVDTWILRDSGVQNGTAPTEDDAAPSSNTSDSSDDEDASESGPAWIRNPRASLFPRLSHAPVVLSFSDDAIGPILREEDEEGPDNYVLLAVTAASRIYAFNPLEGSLTRWSRRNSAWKLPKEIQATRALIKGVVWSGSRIWLYTAASLFMIDLSFDFVEQASESSKESRKRKRGADSGAGSKMEIGRLAPRQVRKSLPADGNGSQSVDVDMVDAEPQANGTGDEDESDGADEEARGGELEKLRTREQRLRSSEGEGDTPSPGAERKKWWHSFKYRPILGVLPLEAKEKIVEVALVELPNSTVEG